MTDLHSEARERLIKRLRAGQLACAKVGLEDASIYKEAADEIDALRLRAEAAEEGQDILSQEIVALRNDTQKLLLRNEAAETERNEEKAKWLETLKALSIANDLVYKMLKKTYVL